MSEMMIDITCRAAEWEINDFANAVAANVGAKRAYVVSYDLGRERTTGEARINLDGVPRLMGFLLNALPTDQTRSGLFAGLERDLEDLGIVVEEVKIW